jgi:monofunctional biosynthetic peptidoglycan transglycosylase
LAAGAVGSILLLRFVPPPTSSMILQERWAAWRSDAPAPEQRWVPGTEISPHVALAVVAAEDQRFPDHWGLDPEAIGDALEEGRQGGRKRGASTITQQVAKNLFLWPGHSYVRKALEAGLALSLEALWSKERILEVYLNIAEFGDGVFGVEAASRRFFGKPASGLTREESALLAAVLPSPRRFRVDRPSAYVRTRQAWILKQMDQLGGAAFLGWDD